ncbi:MAG: M28 family peptidase [Acidobacteriota bacterium]
MMPCPATRSVSRWFARDTPHTLLSRSLPIALAILPGLIGGAAPRAGEEVDLSVVHRIKEEAFRHSQVMEHLYHLADVNGPRLTASPGFNSAARWAAEALKDWGLAGAKLEPWGTFGRSWSLNRYAGRMVRPVYAPLGGIPLAWTGGTDGPVRAAVIAAPLYPTESSEDVRFDLERLQAYFEKYAAEHRGELRGKIVLLHRAREMEEPTRAASRRHDTESLSGLYEAPEPLAEVAYDLPLTRLPEDRKERRRLMASLPLEVMADFWQRRSRVRGTLNAFLRDEGVVAVLTTDERGDGAIAFGESAASWQSGAVTPPPVIALPPEPYDRILRLVAHHEAVEVELDVDVSLPDEPVDGVNVVAERPGHGKHADEIVMVGAHLDSWHGGTGATDNGAGSAVALEAIRILSALDLDMDRSIRIALWSGEEQGLYGSRGYVRKHFADPVTMKLRPEHAKLSGYFNLDNGTGKIRGAYLQGNDMMRPIFAAWLQPFADMDATTISIRNTGGTDHLSFDAVGLPGFQFIQDPLDYGSRTHHSDLDVVDHIQEADLMQASAIMATVLYHAATREEMLPRKPLPEPSGASGSPAAGSR